MTTHLDPQATARTHESRRRHLPALRILPAQLARRGIRAINRPDLVVDRIRRALLDLRPERYTYGISGSLVAQKRRGLLRKRAYGPADLDALAALLDRADEVVAVREAHRRKDDRPERFIAVRHDMDHDLENAVRFAEWEARRGVAATYYVLHTDWYYRHGTSGEPSPFVLEALDRIASLGHEIGLHNNAITAGLLTGEDPVDILARELSYLRDHGFEITGTASHGDPLSRAAGYLNYEVFSDLPHPDVGAPDRMITYVDPTTGSRHSVTLRPVPMAQLGLEYEANAVGRIVSDTGGRWSQPFAELDRHFAAEGGFVQLLVHPVWWALSGESFRSKGTATPTRP